jgi:hypothetical protein
MTLSKTTTNVRRQLLSFNQAHLHRHLRKIDQAFAGTTCPWLQEIVVPITIANIMVPHAEPKQNQNQNIPMA